VKIVTTEEIRGLEAACVGHGISTDDLMEQAGLAVAHEARNILDSAAGKRILVLVGPGNNGGDGLVAARHLARWGASVTAYLPLERHSPDPNLDLALLEEVNAQNTASDPDYRLLDRELQASHLVIDALLGTGRARPLEGPLGEVVHRLQYRKGLLLALDLPTGVDADTGHADPATPRADVTACLGFPKIGLFHSPASNHIGRLQVVDIGIHPDLAKDISLELLTHQWVKARLPQRSADAHKGTFGHALIVGGSTNYPGAAYLAAQAALRSGPGLVTLASPQAIQPTLAFKLTEAIHLPVPDLGLGSFVPAGADALRGQLSTYDALALGCGMGRTPGAQRFLEYLLFTDPWEDKPLVIDADGLNNLALTDRWWEKLKASAILTPHPGEMTRLTGLPTAEVQARRLETAQEWASRWGKVVVLKGAFTVVAGPQGSTWLSPFANPILATGGTGDVLTGIIVGLLAQGLSPEDSACCGVFLHGSAAREVSRTHGDRGGLAGDLIEALPRVTRSILES
jgi:hydroxyethylthiazole kinase-like uncharacterized protein yjeF